MIDTVTVALGNDDVGVLYLICINGSYLLASQVAGIEVAQLGQQDGSLNFVHATVAPQMVEHVVTCRAVVTEGTNHGSQFLVVGRDGSRIAKSAEVLRGIEAMAGSIAECASRSPPSPLRVLVGFAAVGLGIVLDELQAILLAGVANTVPEGKWSLIICGLLISIPIVLFGAQFFLMLMKKIPALVYAGAALLGFTAAKLMVADKGLGAGLEPYSLFMEVGFVVLVLGVGYWLNHRQKSEPAKEG